MVGNMVSGVQVRRMVDKKACMTRKDEKMAFKVSLMVSRRWGAYRSS
ncbi:hypothetical protein [Metabacillus litoralis]|nr:hypothetical protein [Metabacillus litoralis]